MPTHEPEPLQRSVSVQNNPSLQFVLFASLPLQSSDDSLHVSEQSASPSAPGHGLPACPVHAPALLQVSAPLQNKPSLHADAAGSFAVQLSEASLHVSEQSPSPSAPGHGLMPLGVHVPA
jgi:hypothetical protein